MAEFRLELHSECNVHLLYHFASLFCFHFLYFLSFFFMFSISPIRTRSWMMMGWVKPSLMGVKWYLIAILIFISLMINVVEHLFLHYWPSVYLLWRKVYSSTLLIFLVSFLAYFFCCFVLFLSFCCRLVRVLYIFYTKSLSGI